MKEGELLFQYDRHSRSRTTRISILKNDDAYPLAVGRWLDHVHVFFRITYDPNYCHLNAHAKGNFFKMYK